VKTADIHFFEKDAALRRRLHLDILPSAQQRLWPELEGIPAISRSMAGRPLLCGWASSISGFRFLLQRNFEPRQLFDHFPSLRQGRRLQSKLNTLSVEMERGGSLELSFFGGLTLGRVGEPESARSHSLRVASLLDLAGLKCAVVQERALRKDYLDIAALLKSGIRLSEALGAARAL